MSVRTSSVFHNRPILLVDDNRFMLQLLVQILRGFGANMLPTADTAEQAMETLRATAVDCLVVDWLMAPTGGLALIREIRHGPESPRRDLPIVLCTAYAEKGRVLEARQAGVHEILVKPVTALQVYAKLASALTVEREFIVSESYVGPRWRLQHPPEDAPASAPGHSARRIDIDSPMPSSKGA